ncbi:hypothetical protein AVEN_61836-1 [Araneus ventricosus]|uniref:Uncharacterized protein n=1 Tax=Araneus ventricosus TaxID=182803 RepID=A0A4Y2UMU6_ARAVE|nr:hypothetical protein AVEN_61836-1 [Araneus ventricosus]
MRTAYRKEHPTILKTALQDSFAMSFYYGLSCGVCCELYCLQKHYDILGIYKAFHQYESGNVWSVHISLQIFCHVHSTQKVSSLYGSGDDVSDDISL